MSEWRGKVLAHVVESTWFMWEDLGSSPMYAILVCVSLFPFLGFWRETVWRFRVHRQATRVGQPSFWVLVELPGGDVYPPGDASHIGQILCFSRLWRKSNRRERQRNWLNDVVMVNSIRIYSINGKIGWNSGRIPYRAEHLGFLS